MAKNKVLVGGEITLDQKQQLEAKCEALGQSKNQLLGKLITDYLEDRVQQDVEQQESAVKRLIQYCVKNSIQFSEKELLKIAYTHD